MKCIKVIVSLAFLVFPNIVAALDLQLSVGMVNKLGKDCIVLPDSLQLRVQFKNTTNHVVEIEDPQKSVATMIRLEVDSKPFSNHPLVPYVYESSGAIIRPQAPVIQIGARQAYQFETALRDLRNAIPSNANLLGIALVYDLGESSGVKPLSSALLEIQLCPVDLAPQIKEIESVILKTKNKGLSQEVERVGYGDVKRILFLDKLGRAMKYVREGGSEDSHYEMSLYYGKSGKLFYTLVEAGAVSGAKYQVKITFDSTGRRVSEVSKYLTDLAAQGWAFPNPWPNDLIVFDPLTHFKARSWQQIKSMAFNGTLNAVPGEFDLNIPFVISKNRGFAKRVNDAIFEALIGTVAPPKYHDQLSPKHILALKNISGLARKITYEVVENNPQMLSIRFAVETATDRTLDYMSFNSNTGNLLSLDQVFDAHHAETVYKQVQATKLAVYSAEDSRACPEFLGPYSKEQLMQVQSNPFLVTDTSVELLVRGCEPRFGPADFNVKIPFDFIPWK